MAHSLSFITIRSFFAWVALLILLPLNVRAQFYALETRNLRLIYYTKAHEFVVPHLARCFENALQFHQKLFDYTPSERITVILQDFGDYGGGGANTVPFNLVGVGLAPFNYSYETMPPLERMTLMMNHELAHIATMDKASPINSFYRRFFLGKVSPIAEAPLSMIYAYLTSPRWNSPRWFIEGVAVFLETWMGGGLGRALGAYDEMVFRTMVLDSAYFYDVVGLESEGTKVDFQVGANSYLYGTRFVSYLAFQHGPEKLVDWFAQTGEGKNYFGSQFENVFGVSLDTEWSRWIAWEHQWQKDNLDSLHRFPLTRYRALSPAVLGSVSRAFYDTTTGNLYAAINYPGQTAHIAEIDLRTGNVKKIQDVRGAALFYVSSLAFDQSTRTIFYTTDNNQWRDLHALDLRTGKSRMLLKDFRTGDLAFNQSDRSLWGIRHFNGISTIVRIPYPYTESKQVYSWDYGKDMFDIDISPDGRYLVGALADLTGRQVLIKIELEKLTITHQTHEVLLDFENSTPANFTFSQDGRYLFGTSYQSGVSNVVRFDLEQDSIAWISNTEAGFFRPVSLSEDSIITFRYTGKGFVPVMIANQCVEDVSTIRYLGNEVVEKYPVLQSWNLPPPSPSRIDVESLTTFTGSYAPLSNLKLASGYPVVEGYKDFATFGMRFSFSDPILMNALDLTTSYSPNHSLPEMERWHLALNYRYSSWRFSGTYNGADFYDLFGPTKRSRKGYSVALQYKDYLLFDEPETMDFSFRWAAYGDLQQLPDFQNVLVGFDRFMTLNGRVDYRYLGKSLGAVEHEYGLEWRVNSHTTYARSQIIPRINTNLDYGILLPFDHLSLWFRFSAGHGFGNPKDRFSNFYFGGFGNNWIDFLNAERFREDYSFPGIELNDVGGKNYVKAMVEWTLPPLRFRRLGFPTLYGNWMRLSLFTSSIVTNFHSAHTLGDGSGLERDLVRRILANIGAQLDFRLVLFWSLQSTLSIGYASAFERHGSRSDEFMISLKIL